MIISFADAQETCHKVKKVIHHPDITNMQNKMKSFMSIYIDKIHISMYCVIYMLSIMCRACSNEYAKQNEIIYVYLYR